MTNIWKSDLYRFGKSKLFYGIAAFTCIIAFLLIMLIRQEIRLGISIFGDLTVALLSSGQIREMLTPEYAGMMISGVFVYTALGAVICLLSMLVKNNTASIVVCLGYVLFSETLVSVMKNLSSFSDTAARLVEWGAQHSIYGMSSLVSGASVSADLAITILINSFAIMFLSTAIGVFLFRKYEL